MQESGGSRRLKFAADAKRHFENFKAQFGDVHLDELKHYHAALYRDAQLARGLNPTSVRKHINCFNAMLNVAFRYLSIDRLSPFRSLSIANEGKSRRYMPTITTELTLAVKQRLIALDRPNGYVGLIQLNTGCRLSEPLFAKREDLILDHKIPHLWIRPNELTDRKTVSSVRAIPLVGESLRAARILDQGAKDMRSKWLVPQYAKFNGNGSCSAIMNKNLKELKWRSHMFRHAFIDRLKACGDIPVKLAESITGHSSGKSEFDSYGTVGYTLEQKLAVIKRVKL
jgi:integrase